MPIGNQADHYEPRNSPEINLMVAILRQALVDLPRPGHTGRDAWAYLNSRNTEHIHSFQNICSTLGILPNEIRKKAMKLTRVAFRVRQITS